MAWDYYINCMTCNFEPLLLISHEYCFMFSPSGVFLGRRGRIARDVFVVFPACMRRRSGLIARVSGIEAASPASRPTSVWESATQPFWASVASHTSFIREQIQTISSAVLPSNWLSAIFHTFTFHIVVNLCLLWEGKCLTTRPYSIIIPLFMSSCRPQFVQPLFFSSIRNQEISREKREQDWKCHSVTW